MLKVDRRTRQYILPREGEEGFTLVELIVVVVIVGILSSIGIPAFLNLGDKAKQQEATTIVSSYIKAAQAYYVEYGSLATEAGHLDQYVTVINCNARGPNAQNCKNNAGARTYGNSKEWHSPSGLFHVKIRYDSLRTKITAQPTGSYSQSGYGVAGCFNKLNGTTKVTLSTKRAAMPANNC